MSSAFLLLPATLSTSPPQVAQLVSHFQSATGQSLDKFIELNHSGDSQRIFRALVRGRRSDAPLSPPQALDIANRLYKAGEGRMGTDEAVFIDIFTSYSPSALAQVGQQYLNQRGRTLVAAIEKEFSKTTKRALMACLDPEMAYYGNLHATMKGIGTDDTGLVWLIASRPRWDMARICQKYMQVRGKALESDIRGDTSGAYQRALLAYIQPY